MTVPPEPGAPDPDDAPPPPPAYGQPPGYGHAPPPPGYEPDPYGQAPYGYGYPPPGAPGAYGANPAAPYGCDPKTGLPFSDKQKLVAGLLQLLLPLGIGRMYTGHVALGVGQLVVTIVTCGVGALWSFIDGIVILAGDSKDSNGLPLRP